MAVLPRYFCDWCKKEVAEAEILELHNPASYNDTIMPLKLDLIAECDCYISFKLSAERSNFDHICKACVWKWIKEAINQYGPIDTDTDADQGEQLSIDSLGVPPLRVGHRESSDPSGNSGP